MLIESGIKPGNIYLEGRKAESLGSIRFRAGDVLATVHGLRALGEGRHEIVERLARVHRAGAVVMDIETGHKSGPGLGAEMLHAALARIHGERSIGDRAKEMSELAHAAKTKRRMPKAKALLIWRDPTLTVGDALRKMGSGWTQSTAYRQLKSRGLPIGRRGSKR